MHKRHAQTRQNQTRQTSLRHSCLNCWEICTLRKDGKLLACFVCFWKKRAEGRLSAIFMYIKSLQLCMLSWNWTFCILYTMKKSVLAHGLLYTCELHYQQKVMVSSFRVWFLMFSFTTYSRIFILFYFRKGYST